MTSPWLRRWAAKLTTSERAHLAYTLLQSLGAEDEDTDAIERAWLVEVERRWGEIERGDVKPIPGDEAIASVRRKVALIQVAAEG